MTSKDFSDVEYYLDGANLEEILEQNRKDGDTFSYYTDIANFPIGENSDNPAVSIIERESYLSILRQALSTRICFIHNIDILRYLHENGFVFLPTDLIFCCMYGFFDGVIYLLEKSAPQTDHAKVVKLFSELLGEFVFANYFQDLESFSLLDISYYLSMNYSDNGEYIRIFRWLFQNKKETVSRSVLSMCLDNDDVENAILCLDEISYKQNIEDFVPIIVRYFHRSKMCENTETSSLIFDNEDRTHCLSKNFVDFYERTILRHFRLYTTKVSGCDASILTMLFRSNCFRLFDIAKSVECDRTECYFISFITSNEEYFRFFRKKWNIGNYDLQIIQLYFDEKYELFRKQSSDKLLIELFADRKNVRYIISDEIMLSYLFYHEKTDMINLLYNVLDENKERMMTSSLLEKYFDFCCQNKIMGSIVNLYNKGIQTIAGLELAVLIGSETLYDVIQKSITVRTLKKQIVPLLFIENRKYLDYLFKKEKQILSYIVPHYFLDYLSMIGDDNYLIYLIEKGCMYTSNCLMIAMKYKNFDIVEWLFTHYSSLNKERTEEMHLKGCGLSYIYIQSMVDFDRNKNYHHNHPFNVYFELDHFADLIKKVESVDIGRRIYNTIHSLASENFIRQNDVIAINSQIGRIIQNKQTNYLHDLFVHAQIYYLPAYWL